MEIVLERFWSKVNKKGLDDCWEWVASKHPQGYGTFGFKGRVEYAHRVSFELDRGYKPKKCVCHTCDNPSCVNPNHLWEGSQLDNMKDMKIKGRTQKIRGEQHHQSKLTEQQVNEIRERYKIGDVTYKSLGNEYGVDFSTIGYIIRNQIWQKKNETQVR